MPSFPMKPYSMTLRFGTREGSGGKTSSGDTRVWGTAWSQNSSEDIQNKTFPDGFILSPFRASHRIHVVLGL